MGKLLNERPEDRLAGQLPGASGRFGPYGGCFVAETLMGPIAELRERTGEIPAALAAALGEMRAAMDA